MRINFKVTISAAAVFAAMAVLAVFPSQARATTMSPTRLELDADRGQTAQAAIKIYNDDDTARTFYLHSARFETKDETGQPVFVSDDRSGLVSWLSFAPSIQIGPKESKEIPFSISVPQDAEPGGYFAAILASLVPPSERGAGAVAIQSDVGTLVLFRVNGEFSTEDGIVEFAIKNDRRWFANLPVEFFFRFRNSGADRAQPLGDVTVKNIFGGITKIITSNKGAGNVLPQSIRRFDSAWVTSGGDKIEQHTGEVQQPELNGFWEHVSYEWSNFTFGRYRADLNLTVNNDASRSHSAHVSFWVVPWHLLLVIFVAAGLFFASILAVLLVIVMMILRRRDRR